MRRTRLPRSDPSNWLPAAARALLRGSALVWLRARFGSGSGAERPVFILGHMRSGSSLLLHLLISSPEILGYGERNSAYASVTDFRRMAVDIHYHRRRLLRRSRYLIDQINHDRFIESDDLLCHPDLRILLLVREPEASIASMVDVLGRHYGTTLEDSTDYYVARLATLARYARHIDDPDRCRCLTYGELIDDTEQTLSGLVRFLGLEHGLSDRYRVLPFTGRHGDPSERIRSGRIIRDAPPRALTLEPLVRERLSRAYADCRATLQTHCGLLRPT